MGPLFTFLGIDREEKSSNVFCFDVNRSDSDFGAAHFALAQNGHFVTGFTGVSGWKLFFQLINRAGTSQAREFCASAD